MPGALPGGRSRGLFASPLRQFQVLSRDPLEDVPHHPGVPRRVAPVEAVFGQDLRKEAYTVLPRQPEDDIDVLAGLQAGIEGPYFLQRRPPYHRGGH